MRALLWVVLTVAGLWAGYWVVGSRAIESAATQAFLQAEMQGLLVQNGGLGVSGFPNRFDLTVTAPQILDPGSGYGWQSSDLRLLAMTWKPWHLIALAPPVQTITTPIGRFTVTSDDLRGSLVLRPGRDLALRSTVIEGSNLLVEGPLGRVGAAKATFATALDTSRQNSHRIGLRITELTPDPAVSVVLSGLPATLKGLQLDAHVLLTAPLDRHAGARPPEVTTLILDDAWLDWGPLQVRAKGAIAATLDGTADGEINLHIENWRFLPAVLGQAGLIDPVLAPTLLRAFEIMAKGDTDLDTALTFKSGRTSLGALPVGPAPRMIYRQ